MHRPSAPPAPSAAFNPEATPLNQPVQIVQQQPQQAYQQPVVIQQPQTYQSVVPTQQVVYVNQFGQPIAPPQQQQQPKVIVVQPQKTQPTTQVIVANSGYPGNNRQAGGHVVTTAQRGRRGAHDDPSCLWIFAFFGFFCWPIGAIGMCVYNCGNNLGPRQKAAYRILLIATLIGVVFNIILWASA